MAAVNYKKLIALREQRGKAGIEEAFASRDVTAADIDLGKLFAECYGWHNYLACRAGTAFVSEVRERALQEAEGAVSSNTFADVGGQFVYQNVLDSYMAEERVFRDLIPERPASNLDGEKIPGITEIGDEAAVRNEGDPYVLAGVGPDWVFTPPVPDQGFIVPVTWEAVFNDKTGLLVDRCRDVGKWMGIRREKRAIDCVIDENVTAHRYNWKGTVIKTYDDNTGAHTWDNLAASNGLVDWLNLDAAEQLFNSMTDPYTGEPILIEPRYLIVAKPKEQVARRVVSATEIRVATPGFATSGSPTQTTQGNPYLNKYEVLTSRLLGSRMQTKTDWFIGDVTKYAKCMVAEAMNVVQAPPNSPDEFYRRILYQFRANERFAYVATQPRAMLKSTVA